jgi:hypothetical protein
MSNSSILADVSNVIDEALGIENSRFKHQHKKRCQLFSEGLAPKLDWAVLIRKISYKVQSNWHKGKSRSNNQNWRWKQNPSIADKNTSREVYLERMIVKTQEGDDWVNQVPVASGVTSTAGGRRAIDLVHRGKDRWYEFIELKTDHRGGTPLFAAMEILQYGVLYIFSRKYAQDLGYTEKGLLNANGINLRVLAPADYYKPYNDLSWLENGINRGLTSFLTKSNFKMDFKFEAFSLTLSRSSPWVPGGPKRTSP